jgi:hypothetical protein
MLMPDRHRQLTQILTLFESLKLNSFW